MKPPIAVKRRIGRWFRADKRFHIYAFGDGLGDLHLYRETAGTRDVWSVLCPLGDLGTIEARGVTVAEVHRFAMAMLEKRLRQFARAAKKAKR